MVLTLLGVSIFAFLYSFALFVFTESCYADKIKGTWWNFCEMIDMLVEFYIWYIPLFYIFWPTSANRKK